jgi:hypothetical protein
MLVTVYVMVVIPVEIPVTTPDVDTEPTAVAELAQTPDGVVDDSVILLPTQTLPLPVMALTVGSALTVNVKVANVVHPYPLTTVYVTTATPLLVPVTLPAVSMLAKVLPPKDQLPPVTEGVIVIVEPTQTLLTPVNDTAAGVGFTVNDVVL